MVTSPGALFVSAVVFVAVPAVAQQSSGFRQTEHVINAAGDPRQAVVLSSPAFRVTLDAIGEACSAGAMSSPGFRVDANFVGTYAPPGEVQGLRLAADRVTLSWTPERAAGTYDLHGGAMGVGYGACLAPHLGTTHTTDAFVPSPGAARQYLVTVENRIGEEGTLGTTSAGATRPNSTPCP